MQLDNPPFPPLQWSEFFWRGQFTLSSWKGFQRRLGAYAGKSSNLESDGTVWLHVAPAAGVAMQPPSAAQATALEYLLEHQDEIRDSLLEGVFAEYPMIRQNRLADGMIEESAMPIFDRPGQLQSYLGLSTVHILSVARQDAAYIGFEFGCAWDDEHGLGMMTHQGRIIEFPEMGVGKVNGADIASEAWLAEADAEALD